MSGGDPRPASSEDVTSCEDLLRKLDQVGARAVLEADAETLGRLYSPDHLLHFAPARAVRTREQVLDDVREARIPYASFSRVTEHVSVHGEVGVTIGSEVAVIKGEDPAHHGAKPNQVLERRYTHIWRNDGSAWRLLVRHVSLVDSK
jgi:ketosteroid isomerase-like protein